MAELLSPAGDMERLKSAVQFGADAVYLGGSSFGMRTAPKNFGEDLQEAVAYAHSHGVKVYLVCNILPHSHQIDRLPAFLQDAAACGVDAFIISDLGALTVARQAAPQVPVHISTQAGIVNYATANAFHEMGASRVILARELSMEEIAVIRDKTPADLEIETFVHGSMCVSFSGRCLLSSYLTGRDANRGDCAQPCRWKYHLVEENRPGEFLPIEEQDGGTYILNAKDLCMIRHLVQLEEAGVTSFKIEGRAKSAYYTAVATSAYRAAMDFYKDNPGQSLPQWIEEELDKVSHRPYGTGFYFGPAGQETVRGGYTRNYQVIAVAEGWEEGRLILTQRNRFFPGEEADCLPPRGRPFSLTIEDLRDEEGNPVEAAPHPMQRLSVKCSQPIPPGTLLRKRA